MRRQQDEQAALLSFQKAIDILSQLPLQKETVGHGREFLGNSHISRAQLLTKIGRHGEAVEDWKRAAELCRGREQVLCHVDYAMSLVKNGRADEAIASYKKAIDLGPKFAHAHNSLAWLLATCDDPSLRDPRQAIELAQRAIALEPKNAAIWNTLGVAQYRAGQWDAAITTLEESNQLGNGGSPVDWFVLAMAHWQLEHKEDARQWYEKGNVRMKRIPRAAEEMHRFHAEAKQLLASPPKVPQEDAKK